MIAQRKAPSATKGLSQKLYLHSSNISKDYLGARNRIPSQKEIIDGYWLSLEFFKQREEWHQETASWYFNHMREMEAKAGKHLDLAEVAHANYSHYLELIGMTVLNSGRVNHAR